MLASLMICAYREATGNKFGKEKTTTNTKK
jgi:hypothetical protein